MYFSDFRFALLLFSKMHCLFGHGHHWCRYDVWPCLQVEDFLKAVPENAEAAVQPPCNGCFLTEDKLWWKTCEIGISWNFLRVGAIFLPALVTALWLLSVVGKSNTVIRTPPNEMVNSPKHDVGQRRIYLLGLLRGSVDGCTHILEFGLYATGCCKGVQNVGRAQLLPMMASSHKVRTQVNTYNSMNSTSFATCKTCSGQSLEQSDGNFFCSEI